MMIVLRAADGWSRPSEIKLRTPANDTIEFNDGEKLAVTIVGAEAKEVPYGTYDYFKEVNYTVKYETQQRWSHAVTSGSKLCVY